MLLFCCTKFLGQTDRSLEETKSYIVSTMNKHATQDKQPLKVQFEGDLMRVQRMDKKYERPLEKGHILNCLNIYRIKGPLREPGNVAEVIIWVDYLVNPKRNKWDKNNFSFLVDDHDAAEQIILAFEHLNRLLKAQNSKVEKF